MATMPDQAREEYAQKHVLESLKQQTLAASFELSAGRKPYEFINAIVDAAIQARIPEYRGTSRVLISGSLLLLSPKRQIRRDKPAIGHVPNRKPVILCVDDEEAALTLRRLVLEMAGYKVITALSGMEALQIVESRPVDLVLSDYLMPGMNGAQLCREIKRKHSALPVLLISGLTDVPPDAGIADGFLSKLVGTDVLFSEITAMLNRASR
jgi:CheY-like chemotaxis protein